MSDSRKELFSIPVGEHYLNCAYMAPLSKRVEAAGIEGVRRKSTPWRIRERDFFDETDRARALFARLIHAPDPARVAIVPAASYGFAQIARNTDIARGQNIVTVAEEFPSTVYTWRRLATETGAELRVVTAPADGDWTGAMLNAIDDATRIVSATRAHWTDGTLFDLERIGAHARGVGAALLIDGSQTVGAEPFDVTRVRPDAVICPAYKWLTGPYSIGCAWFSDRYDDGNPVEASWMVREGSDDFAGLVRYTDRYRPGAVRYDVGETSNFALMPMLVAALEQLLEWTPEAIQSYTRALTSDLVATLGERGFAVPGDADRAGHLFGLRLPGGTDPDHVRRKLAADHVWVSVRGDAVRVSAHLFNDEGDVEALRAALLSV